MNELTLEERNALVYIITEAYDITEMELLSNRLGVPLGRVSAQATEEAVAQRMVGYFERRRWIDRLIDEVYRQRPEWFENSPLMERISPEDDYDSPVDITTRNNDVSCLEMIAGPATLLFIILGLIWFYEFQAERRLREPDQFVTNYFNTLDNQGAGKAWEYLSGDYRVNKHPTGLAPYSNYWRSFTNVEVVRVAVLDETELSANVEVFLALTNADGSVVNQSSVYRLARLTVDEPWKIDDSSP